MWSQPLNTNFVTDRSNPNAVILGLRYAFFMPTSLLSIVSMSAEAHRYYCKLAILEPQDVPRTRNTGIIHPIFSNIQGPA